MKNGKILMSCVCLIAFISYLFDKRQGVPRWVILLWIAIAFFNIHIDYNKKY